jgi:hypothetical protein
MSMGDERPGWRRARVQERLTGLAIILAGVVGFGLVYLLWRYPPPTLPAPAGLPPGLLPIASPLNCMLPTVAIGSCALVLIGLRRLVLPN